MVAFQVPPSRYEELTSVRLPRQNLNLVQQHYCGSPFMESVRLYRHRQGKEMQPDEPSYFCMNRACSLTVITGLCC